ncbi:hypothetical protein GCM10022403_076990 [Streptomyces coacervatus]|uniref:Uncharacterized protein n=1 Tax=Streptomyces coacervatus TaxID=647381 RepID=A0ABP7J1L7_9ACTN|nr:hypothetical protein [Streptomyces coacervatus]MDF2273130.1 hypothetical protein [Streptomyces coacervatus]
MPALLVYKWASVYRKTAASLYIHGIADDWALVYSAVGWGQEIYQFPSPPQVDFTLYQGRVLRHVDGTVARKVTVSNDSDYPAEIHLHELYAKI